MHSFDNLQSRKNLLLPEIHRSAIMTKSKIPRPKMKHHNSFAEINQTYSSKSVPRNRGGSIVAKSKVRRPSLHNSSDSDRSESTAANSIGYRQMKGIKKVAAKYRQSAYVRNQFATGKQNSSTKTVLRKFGAYRSSRPRIDPGNVKYGVDIRNKERY